jgi:hypothetical protein
VQSPPSNVTFERDIDAFALEQRTLISIMSEAADDQWLMDSGGCPGWTVKDIFLHLGLTIASFVDRGSLPDVRGLPAERGNDVLVQSRASWTREMVIENYAASSERIIQGMRAMRGQTDVLVPMGDIGTYPFAQVVKAYVWDHYTHINCDLAAPDGPLRCERLPSVEHLMAPAVDWIFAALPQQHENVPPLMDALRFDLTGPGGRQIFVLERAGRFVVAEEPPSTITATIHCSTENLLRWATRRASWEDLAEVYGDRDSAAAAISAIRVF